jgi:hypothetical protein
VRQVRRNGARGLTRHRSLPRGEPDQEGPDDSVSDPRRTLAQAERRLRQVMERHGITRTGL